MLNCMHNLFNLNNLIYERTSNNNNRATAAAMMRCSIWNYLSLSNLMIGFPIRFSERKKFCFPWITFLCLRIIYVSQIINYVLFVCCVRIVHFTRIDTTLDDGNAFKLLSRCVYTRTHTQTRASNNNNMIYCSTCCIFDEAFGECIALAGGILSFKQPCDIEFNFEYPKHTHSRWRKTTLMVPFAPVYITILCFRALVLGVGLVM